MRRDAPRAAPQQVRGSRGAAERERVRGCVADARPGPGKTRCGEILEEKYKIDEEAADRWREEEGLPPLSKEEREAMLDKIMSDDDRSVALRSTKAPGAGGPRAVLSGAGRSRHWWF